MDGNKYKSMAYNILSWIFGVLFLIISLVPLFSLSLNFFVFIAIACFLLPPVRNFIYAKTQVKLEPKTRAKIIGGLLLLFLVITLFESYKLSAKQDAEREAIQLEEKKKEDEKITQEFNNDKSKILKETYQLLYDNRFDEVISIGNKYAPANDAQLMKYKEMAIIGQKKEGDRKLKSELLDIIAKGNPDDEERLGIYTQLSQLEPNNQYYKEQFEIYNKKALYKELAEKKKAEDQKIKQELELAILGEKPIRSGFDGSYREVKNYLKQTAKDPSSIDISNCSGVYKTDKGWLVYCEYRGKNSFGALVREANWFTILRNTVVNVEPANAYTLD